MIDAKKNNLLKRLSYRFLITTFSISVGTIILKLLLSKKLRRSTWNFIVGTSFSVFIIVSGGSLIAIFLKKQK